MSEPVRTVYWCPLCGRMDWPGLQPPDWAKGNEIHIRRDKKGNCEGVPVERWLVDPAEAREGHEVRWSDGAAYGENYVQFNNVPHAMRQYVTRVLVVPVPVPPTKQEAS